MCSSDLSGQIAMGFAGSGRPWSIEQPEPGKEIEQDRGEENDPPLAEPVGKPTKEQSTKSKGDQHGGDVVGGEGAIQPVHIAEIGNTPEPHPGVESTDHAELHPKTGPESAYANHRPQVMQPVATEERGAVALASIGRSKTEVFGAVSDQQQRGGGEDE